jgi:selenocysteine-specific elongation factor
LFVIGTAGHVDHGKSTLVHALTGIDPDRLAEEKAREMTIELGFAWFTLPGGLEVSVIDVPGHEHFIKNMLAGVSGMDLALLVVAANESIKPQTREHLAIMDLMEVPQAVIVITQSDLVDSDQITLVGMEIEDLIHPTRFAGAPVVSVSAVTGQGLDELKLTIEKVLKTAQPRRDTGKPRLPIDRVFTISGSGTVVTGTLEDGSFMLGQEVQILPPALSSRIKSLQAHKSKLNSIGPGNRVAVNLVGLSLAEIKRGQVLTTPGWLTPTNLIDARLKLLAQPDRPLRHNTEVSLHTGSAEVTARVRVLEKKEALPGETTWVQFILDAPMAVVNGDHYVIRSPNETLGGGIILDAHPQQRHRRFCPEIIENFKTRSEGKIEKTLLTILKSKPPLEPDKLISESGLNEELALSGIETLLQQGTAVMVGEGKNVLLYPESDWKQTIDGILALVRDYQRQFPIRPGIPKAEINNKIKLGKHFQDIMQKLISQGLVVEESSLVHLPGFQIKISPGQQVQADTYMKQLNLNPYSPAAGISLDTDLLNLLVYRGDVVKTASGTVFSAAAFSEMVLIISNHLKQSGKITVAEARDLLGSSRKYVLALLEQMDEMKLTKRVGDERVAGEDNKA